MSRDVLNALRLPAIRQFIEDHGRDDVAVLALKKPPEPGWPYREILEQIKARQKAAKKLPAWLDAPGLVFPAPDTVEQASSTATARYKAGLVKAADFIDLTGGAGVDSWACAGFARSGTVIEKNPDSAALLAHNFECLVPGQLQVVEGSAEEILPGLPRAQLILLDPQRREGAKRGIFRLADGSPNVLELLPVLREKTRLVLLKTSPLLDIAQTLQALPQTTAVHVLEKDGECKEVLYLIDFEAPDNSSPTITAAALDEDGTATRSLTFTREEEEACSPRLGPPGPYLFEPGPAFLKAGCFKRLAERFALSKLGLHTHLYTGPSPCPDFPGRHFQVMETLPVHRKAVKAALPSLKANLTLRNFPDTTETLRKKLGLSDGGAETLFACTLENGEKTLLRARKF
jgi:hypothetical protein